MNPKPLSAYQRCYVQVHQSSPLVGIITLQNTQVLIKCGLGYGKCYEVYPDCAHLSWPFVKHDGFRHLFDSDLFGLATLLVGLIGEGDLGSGVQRFSIRGVTRVDEDTRAIGKSSLSS